MQNARKIRARDRINLSRTTSLLLKAALLARFRHARVFIIGCCDACAFNNSLQQLPLRQNAQRVLQRKKIFREISHTYIQSCDAHHMCLENRVLVSRFSLHMARRFVGSTTNRNARSTSSERAWTLSRIG
jgi:hypothetical protein